eukprot:763318-Hanusia_phi.AAC.13
MKAGGVELCNLEFELEAEEHLLRAAQDNKARNYEGPLKSSCYCPERATEDNPGYSIGGREHAGVRMHISRANRVPCARTMHVQEELLLCVVCNRGLKPASVTTSQYLTLLSS